MLVRNLSLKSRRIRIGKPKTKYFKCEYNMVEARAAGIPMKLTVSFETHDLTKTEYTDELKIMSDGQEPLIIPMFAYAPNPVIVFEPIVNLGFVQTKSEKFV